MRAEMIVDREKNIENPDLAVMEGIPLEDPWLLRTSGNQCPLGQIVKDLHPRARA
jgi:hypothetical protein